MHSSPQISLPNALKYANYLCQYSNVKNLRIRLEKNKKFIYASFRSIDNFTEGNLSNLRTT